MKNMMVGLIALGALAGCGATDTGQVKLGVSVAALQSSTVASEATVAAGLEVTRVRILVNVAKVGYTGNHDGGADSAEAGPFVVELTGDEITAGAQRQFDLGELATGTYGGAEIEIDRPSSGATSSDPSLADFQAAGASVLIDGTYQGTAFTFAGHFLAEQGTDGEVTIDAATPASLDMSVDPTTWFVDASGAVLDPTDATHHAAIAAAICKSLDTQPQLGPTGGGSHGDGPGGAAHCLETGN